MTLRALAKRALPPPLRALIQRLLERYRRAVRYKHIRGSPTDYVAEFDHRSFRKAKASILWHDDWDQATRETVRILRRLALVRDGDTVMDYGCGVGRITRALAEGYRLRLLAVDRSAEMRRHARRYVPQACFGEGGVELLSDTELFERLPALAGSVDTILCIEVLQHIPEPVLDELLPRLLPALKATGRLFVLGNEVLDVDAAGRLAPRSSPVVAVLERHSRVERRDIWTEGFAHPRFSFLCSAPPRTTRP
jgi:2-polyprenyl-3-methyl-5-hydroxy-6-metoxy-1,4-benzoquinol methylase